MNIRKSFAALCASLLAATLISLGLSWSAWHVMSQPDYIKQTLRESGVYDAVVQDVVKQKANDLAASANVAGDSAGLQDAVSKGISPNLLQEQTEKVIDNSFGWFQGKQDTLEASFDFSSAKQQVGDSVAAYTEKRLRSLPTCTPAETLRLSPNMSPLQATCLPAGFNITAAVNEARAKVVGSEAFNKTLNANEVEAGEGKTLQQQLASGPQVYQRMQWIVYGQGILAILLAVGLVLLSSDWRVGIRRLGVIALWTGVVSAGIAWMSGAGVKYAIDKLSANTAGVQVLQQKIISIAQIIIDDIRMWWLYYGIALALFGVILLVIYWLVRPAPAKVAAFLAKEEGVTVTPLLADPPKGVLASETPKVTPTPEVPKRAPAPTPRKPRRIQ